VNQANKSATVHSVTLRELHYFIILWLSLHIVHSSINSIDT